MMDIPKYLTYVTGYNVTLTVDAVLGTEDEPQIMTVKIGDVDLLTEAWWDDVEHILNLIRDEYRRTNDNKLLAQIESQVTDIDSVSGDLDEEVKANRADAGS